MLQLLEEQALNAPFPRSGANGRTSGGYGSRLTDRCLVATDRLAAIRILEKLEVRKELAVTTKELGPPKSLYCV